MFLIGKIAYIPYILLFSAMLRTGDFCFQGVEQEMALSRDHQRIASEEYSGIFLSTYDISNFSENDFTIYAGVPTLKLDHRYQSAFDINMALDEALSSGNTLTHIYMGLDPLTLSRAEGDDIVRVQEYFEDGWLSYADAHPEVTFDILLSFPSLEYWKTLRPEETESAILLYEQLLDILGTRDNITVYYAGSSEWLICNPANYVSDFALNDLASQKLFLYTFCDHELQISADNASLLLEQTRGLIAADTTAEYPDLSEYDIVFLGDSIVGNYAGSISIPGVVNGLSGACVFNCAEGHISAAVSMPEDLNFPRMAEEFLSGAPADPESHFAKGVAQYYDADHSGQKLCFVINYGLNDYFNGLPVDNPDDPYDICAYSGAIRTGIASLRQRFPDAVYIIMGPGTTTYFDNGTEKQSEQGGTMEEYYHMAAALSEELGTAYIDLYSDFPENGEDLFSVLADGCHYNENGRFKLGRKFVRFFGEHLL